MSLLNAVVVAAAETPVHMIAPTWVFPLISAGVFILLGFVVYSFRDVANRHSHKTNGAGTGGTSHH